MIRSAPIVSNTTAITNVMPNSDGTLPAAGGGAAPEGGAAPGGVAPAGGGTGAPPAGPGGPPNRSQLQGRRPRILPASRPRMYRMPRTVPLERGYRGSNLDPLYVNLQGQGAGSVSPLAENAYSGLLGSVPAAIFWGAFHGGSSAINVWQMMMLKVWSPVCRIYIKGEWDRDSGTLLRCRSCGRPLLVGRHPGRVQQPRDERRDRGEGRSGLDAAQRGQAGRGNEQAEGARLPEVHGGRAEDDLRPGAVPGAGCRIKRRIPRTRGRRRHEAAPGSHAPEARVRREEGARLPAALSHRG